MNFTKVIEEIIKALNDFLNALLNLLKDFFLFIWKTFLDIVDYIITLLPIPNNNIDLSGIYSQLDSKIVAIISAMGIPEIISLYMIALLIRLTIKFIPFVG